MLTSSEQANVAIIGCGAIGAEWGDSTDSGSPSLSHAAAFSRCVNSQVVAFCDSVIEKANVAVARWKVGRAYSDIKLMLKNEKIDVLVIATPSYIRLSIIEMAIKSGVKTFVIEKPLASSFEEASLIIQVIEKFSANTIVNFSRRWDPSMQEMRKLLIQGHFGKIQRIVGYYGKGISNNGSHMIDLVSYLISAKPISLRALGSPLPDSESDWSEGNDKSIDAQINYMNSSKEEYNLTLISTNQSYYSYFDLTIICANSIIELTNGGRFIQVLPIINDFNFRGYKIPGKAEVYPTRYLESMDNMAREAVSLATGKCAESSCDVLTAISTVLVVDKIKISSTLSDCSWLQV